MYFLKKIIFLKKVEYAYIKHDVKVGQIFSNTECTVTTNNNGIYIFLFRIIVQSITFPTVPKTKKSVEIQLSYGYFSVFVTFYFAKIAQISNSDNSVKKFFFAKRFKLVS